MPMKYMRAECFDWPCRSKAQATAELQLKYGKVQARTLMIQLCITSTCLCTGLRPSKVTPLFVVCVKMFPNYCVNCAIGATDSVQKRLKLCVCHRLVLGPTFEHIIDRVCLVCC